MTKSTLGVTISLGLLNRIEEAWASLKFKNKSQYVEQLLETSLKTVEIMRQQNIDEESAKNQLIEEFKQKLEAPEFDISIIDLIPPIEFDDIRERMNEIENKIRFKATYARPMTPHERALVQ